MDEKIACFFDNGKKDAEKIEMDPFVAELERGETRPGPQMHQPQKTETKPTETKRTTRIIVTGAVGRRLSGRDKGPDLQPSGFVKDYIEEKRAQIQDRDDQEEQQSDGHLMIGWYDEEDQQVLDLSETQKVVARNVLDAWVRSSHKKSQQRAQFYADKWHNIVRKRQLDLENQFRSQRRAPKIPFHLRPRSDSSIRRRTSGSRHRSPNPDSRDRDARGSLIRSLGLKTRSQKLKRQSTMLGEQDIKDSDSSHSQPQSNPTGYAQSGSSSPDDVRPVNKLFSEDADSEDENYMPIPHYMTRSLSISLDSSATSDSEGEPLTRPPRRIPESRRKGSQFLDEPTTIREETTPLKDATSGRTLPETQWTKIDRRKFSRRSLDMAGKRYEESFSSFTARHPPGQR